VLYSFSASLPRYPYELDVDMKGPLSFAGFGSVLCIVLWQGTAIAAPISDRMVVMDPSGNVLPVIDSNGNVLPNGELPESVEPLNPGASNVIIFGPAMVFGDPRLFASSNLSLALLEPDGTVSDVIFVILTVPEGGNGVLQINFFSDPEQPLIGFNGIPETGELQDVSRFLFPAFADPQDAPFRVSVQSDVETVAEPSTLVLLVPGLVVGICRLRTKQRRRF
jgi:hypothetical protein